MSLWEDGRNLFLPSSPFMQPQPDPGTAPGDGPYVCVQFNEEWLPLVVGAIAALVEPQVWGMTGSSDPTGVLSRATELVNIFALSGACVVTQAGSEAVTINTGQASSNVAVTFPEPFTHPPIVLVASNDGHLHAWFSDITATGFIANLDADVPVVANTSGVVSWTAIG